MPPIVSELSRASPLVLALTSAGALLWLLYFRTKDRLQPEPGRVLALAVAAGLCSAIAALGVFWLVAAVGGPQGPGTGTWSIALYCLLVVGPIEEGAKFAAARVTVFRMRAFDEVNDGMVYATAVAIGFAAFENLLYLPYLSTAEQIARSLASPLTHALFASLWGYGAGRALIRETSASRRIVWQALPLAAAALIHGAYDALLLIWGATLPASGVILALWILLIWNTRHQAASKPASPAD